MLEVIFKLIPTVLIAGLNMRIMLVYRKTCQRRREMLISRSNCVRDEDPRKFAEERRLFLLLGRSRMILTNTKNLIKIKKDLSFYAMTVSCLLVLGSTSILFLVCVSPMAIVHMTIASEVLPNFSFQVCTYCLLLGACVDQMIYVYIF